jgi:hypothetical protein
VQIRATLTAVGAVWFQVRASTCHDEPAQEEVVQALLELQRTGQEHGKPDPVSDRSTALEMMGVEQQVATVRRF